jgi:hypothetical protein
MFGIHFSNICRVLFGKVTSVNRMDIKKAAHIGQAYPYNIIHRLSLMCNWVALKGIANRTLHRRSC